MGEAVGCVTKAVDLALRIKDAVDTVRQNRKDCAHIKRRVERVRHTLSLCEGNAELMESPAVCDAVEALAEVLGYALELVTGCQEETNAVCLYCTAGKVSKQLGKVDRGISDRNSEATFAILVYHISKQTRDGAGPAMPTATDQERWSLQIEEQIELHSRGKSKNHTIMRAATMPSNQHGRDRRRHLMVRQNSAATLVRPTKKLHKAATTSNMARVPETRMVIMRPAPVPPRQRSRAGSCLTVDDRDRDVAREGRRGTADHWDAQGSIRRERTRSPRRREHADSTHGRRREAGPDEMVIDYIEHVSTAKARSQMIPSAQVFRSMLNDQATMLKKELLECVNGMIKPVLEESIELRNWLARAVDFLRAATAPAPCTSPVSPISSGRHEREVASFEGGDLARGGDGRTSQLPSPGLEDGVHSSLHVPVASPPGHHFEALSMPPMTDAWLCPPEAEGLQGGVDDAALFLTQLGIKPRNEAWDVAAVIPSLQAGSPPPSAPTGAPQRQVSVPALLSTPVAKKKKKALPPAVSPRRSGWIAIKKKTRQLSEGAEAIQEIIAHACGILAPSASFDDASRVAFHQLFLSGPLASSAIQALDSLVKQVKKIKKKATNKTVAAAPTVSSTGLDV